MNKEAQPENPRDENTRNAMQQIGAVVDEHLPQGYKFLVLAWPSDEEPLSRCNYVTNAKSMNEILGICKSFNFRLVESEDAFGKHV